MEHGILLATRLVLILSSILLAGCGSPRNSGPGASFGATCVASTDCESGLCVTAGASRFCSKRCNSDCDCSGSFVCVSAGADRVCGPGTNTCGAPPPDAGTAPDAGPPDTGVEAPPSLGFDPSNLNGWIHGQSLGTDQDVLIGCPSCRCRSAYFNTDTGEAMCLNRRSEETILDVPFHVVMQPGAPVPADSLGVFLVNSLTIQDGGTIAFNGDRPGVLVAMEHITVTDGKIVANAGGWVFPDLASGAQRGFGPGGGGFSTAVRPSGGAGGGAGGSFCSGGGLGASMTVGAGATYGSVSCSPLLGGSTGATPGGIGSGDGGDGGGALQLVAGTKIEIGSAGVVVANGHNGGGSSVGSGGGSGGALLLEAPTVVIGGQLSANGDRGGTRLGGAGAYDEFQAGNGTEDSSAYGGGGGGIGRIRINTDPSGYMAAIDSLISPFLATGCTTLGRLQPRSSPPPTATCSGVTLASDSCGACLGEQCCARLQACEGSALCQTCRTSATPGPACGTDALVLAVQTCQDDRCPGACR